MINVPVPPPSYEFDWRRTERSLVGVGQPTVGTAVVLHKGVIVTTEHTLSRAANANHHNPLIVPLMAADDYRWRGAMAGVLAIENGTAVLGVAGLDADAREALDRLLHERLAVHVATVRDTSEVALSVPMPNGTWLRLPALASDDRTLIIRAAPLAGCEVIFELLDGVPALTEAGQLAGFVRVFRSPRSGQLVLLTFRADAALVACSRASARLIG